MNAAALAAVEFHRRLMRRRLVASLGLLAALTVMNTFAHGQQLAFDARVGALLVAALALWARLPFLAVVVLGAAAAAVLRWAGWG